MFIGFGTCVCGVRRQKPGVNGLDRLARIFKLQAP